MFHSKREITNVLSILVACPDDGSVLLLFDENRGDYWIPSTKMDSLWGWKDNLKSFKKKLFEYEIINETLLKIFKIWTLEKDYFHLLFQVNLPKEIKSKCQTDTKIGKVGWFSRSQIARLKPLLRSLELLEVTHNYVPKLNGEAGKFTGEIMPIGCLTEVRESDVLVTPDSTVNQVYLELLESAGLMPSGEPKNNTANMICYPNLEQYNLYEDFFMLTYPCMYMNHVAFRRAIERFNFHGDLESLFHAADAWKRGFLTFQDFLYLIAVMDPYTSHCGHLAELRCQYIFRYYNKKGDGKLDYRNFHSLMSDIRIMTNESNNKMELDNQVELIAKTIDFKTNSVMTFDQFYSYVLQTTIRNTALLLRFEQSHYEAPMSEFKDASDINMPNRIFLSSILRPSDQQKKCDALDYSIVLKTTILKPGQTSFQIRDLRLLEDTMTKSVADDYKVLSNIRLMRQDSFDLDAKINELMLALKYFSMEICESPICCGECEFEEKEAFTWGSAYIENLGITLIMMAENVREIMRAEPRLLEIEPSVFIMGDLHGNFHDLMCFEKTLWPNGVALAPAKLLFLGDYVDRGLNSSEVVMYLFANKILNPRKLFLIRGNHEIRDIQKLFTFQRECIYKFGNTLGMSVWKAVNEAFDTMPLAAVVDGKVFCCHGGIPPPWLCPVIATINLIPCPLINCERQSPLAWTLMWNDPLKRSAPRNSSQEVELLANEGFIPNVQRGTAFAFNCDALEKFLLTNNLSHVVRAHEVVRAGFQVHQKGKLLTVFSSSGYCGGNNFAGSILVADKLLRVFMVDTGIN